MKRIPKNSFDNLREIIGKTVADVEDCDGVIAIRFTDDTYVYGEAEGEDSYISWTGQECLSTLSLAGVLSKEEFAIRNEEDRLERIRYAEAELERLKSRNQK